jgi:BolA protein
MTIDAHPPNQDRAVKIRQRLEAVFAPAELEITDDSHRHIGHAGARDGRGHFTVRIVAARFAGTKPLERHRLVYAALAELMLSDIHALSLVAVAPEEQ